MGRGRGEGPVHGKGKVNPIVRLPSVGFTGDDASATCISERSRWRITIRYTKIV